MRSSRVIVLLLGLSIASCGPKSIDLADGSCGKVSVGDHVSGIAILHSYAGLGCIECGDYLTREGCTDRLGFRTANEQIDQVYDVITRHRSADDPQQPVERRVMVSGLVIANGATGKPLVNADHLAAAR